MTAPTHKLKQSEAKKLYPKMLANATKRNAKTVATARRGQAKASTAAAKLKKDGEKANAAAFKARLGPLQAGNAHVRAGVLESLLGAVRGPG